MFTRVHRAGLCDTPGEMAHLSPPVFICWRNTPTGTGSLRRENNSMSNASNVKALPRKASRTRVADTGRPMSQVIRERIRDAGRRFHANDNISEFIHSGVEREALQKEVETRVQALLESLVIDTNNDHNTQDTARRVAKMYLKEVFRGRYEAMPAVTEFPNVERLSELIVVGPVTVRSACSHHLCPILGKIWIGVLPNANSKLIGLSKYARVADWVMSRPQIQEEAVKTLADELERLLLPDGLAVIMEADHFCMHWRGVKDESSMTSSIMRGSFLKSDALRRELLSLLKRN
jgi:GTP cyclohydrolase I